jgi:hypothetical protein
MLSTSGRRSLRRHRFIDVDATILSRSIGIDYTGLPCVIDDQSLLCERLLRLLQGLVQNVQRLLHLRLCCHQVDPKSCSQSEDVAPSMAVTSWRIE